MFLSGIEEELKQLKQEIDWLKNPNKEIHWAKEKN